MPFLKFDPTIYENDASPFGKGGPRGIFQVGSLLNPPFCDLNFKDLPHIDPLRTYDNP
jgi:hypothetical protein